MRMLKWYTALLGVLDGSGRIVVLWPSESTAFSAQRKYFPNYIIQINRSSQRQETLFNDSKGAFEEGYCVYRVIGSIL